MRKIISELPVGGAETLEALLLSMEKKNGKNGPYTVLKISDGKGKYDVKFWKVVPEDIGVSEGSIVTIKLDIGTYNGNPNYVTDTVFPYVGDEVTLGDFIVMPPYDIEEMYSYVISTLESESLKAQSITYSADGRNEPVSNIALSLIKDNATAFKRSVAATGMHHDIYGGLLLHTYEMMKAASGLLQAFPDLDSELLLSAVAIHDIGKIYTYTTSETGVGSINSLEVLDGHLAIGYAAVMKESKKHSCPPERVHLLEHMVASHHGKPEWGAIAKPSTPEAFLVFAIDYIDSRLYMYNREQAGVNPGEYSGRVLGLDGANVYRPTYLK